MPTCTTYTASSHMTVPLSLAGRPPWRRRRPCTGAPGRNFPLDVGATASSGRRSPKTVLSAHRGGLALSPRGPCNDISDGTGGGSERGEAPFRVCQASGGIRCWKSVYIDEDAISSPEGDHATRLAARTGWPGGTFRAVLYRGAGTGRRVSAPGREYVFHCVFFVSQAGRVQ